MAGVLLARRAGRTSRGMQWDERRRIKLMSDHTEDSPLWSDDGLTDARALGLSPRLAEDLLAWHEHFHMHFGGDAGWDSERSALWYELQAHPLRDRVQHELGARYAVTLDLWPVAYRGSA